MASVGAFYVLSGQHVDDARTFLQAGSAGRPGARPSRCSSRLERDRGRMIARHQPVTWPPWKGSSTGAPRGRRSPSSASPTWSRPSWTTRSWCRGAELPHLPAVDRRKCRDSTHSRRTQWPDNIPLLYYSYHIMVGLGTLIVGLMALSALLLWEKRLFDTPACALGPDARVSLSPTSPPPPDGSRRKWAGSPGSSTD